MPSTKRSALAPGFTVDTTALNSNAQALLATPDVATGGKLQAPSGKLQAKDSSFKQEASSDEQQASSAKPRAASSSI